MKNSYPRLCGGTFFVLLLRAKRTKAKKEIQKFSNNGITNPGLLKGLITIFDPEYYESSGSSIETNTSRYKKCEISKSDSLPFDQNALIMEFDRKIKSNYYNKLLLMKKLVDFFLTTDKEPKTKELVYSVLNLIKADESIKSNEPFYVLPNGVSISKRELLTTTEINLYALLLGVWHYILMNRKDNTIGAETISSWHSTPLEKGDVHPFTSTIGDSYHLDIKISTTCEDTYDATSESNTATFSEVIDDEDDEDVEILETVNVEEELNNNFNEQPIINNQFIFNQSGNGVNIGQATNVIIKNGKVVDAE